MRHMISISEYHDIIIRIYLDNANAEHLIDITKIMAIRNEHAIRRYERAAAEDYSD